MTWQPVVGFEGRYEISDGGYVRSFARKNPRIIVGKTDKRGYRHVLLYDGANQRVMRTVHTLVLEAFVGPRPSGYHGCHYDGNPSNNMLTNLRWDTAKANQADSRRHGTLRGAHKGAAHHGAKLWDDAIRAIKAEPAFPGVNNMLARAFDVSRRQIRDIRAGKYWGHVSP